MCVLFLNNRAFDVDLDFFVKEMLHIKTFLTAEIDLISKYDNEYIQSIF